MGAVKYEDGSDCPVTGWKCLKCGTPELDPMYSGDEVRVPSPSVGPYCRSVGCETRMVRTEPSPAPVAAPVAAPITVLEEAGLLVNQGGDRNDAYDHPYHNFSKIAAVAEIVFGVKATPRQVGLFMIGMKMVRDSHKARRDNIVDIAGYARCIERLEELRPEQQ